MTEELLHGSNVVAVRQEVGGEAVAQAVERRGPGDPCPLDCRSERSLNGSFVEVVANLLMSLRIEDPVVRGKEILPSPLGGCPRVLDRQCVRQSHLAKPGRQVLPVNPSGSLELIPQSGLKRGGQHRDAVLLSFAGSHHEHPLLEVEILDPQVQALGHSEASTVDQREVDPLGTLALGEHAPDLFRGENHGESPPMRRSHHRSKLPERAFEHVAIEKQQGAQRLILGRRTDPTGDRQVGQEGADLRFAEVLGVSLAVKQDEAANPMDIGFLGSWAAVEGSQGATESVQQARLGRAGSGGGFVHRFPVLSKKKDAAGPRGSVT